MAAPATPPAVMTEGARTTIEPADCGPPVNVTDSWLLARCVEKWLFRRSDGTESFMALARSATARCRVVTTITQPAAGRALLSLGAATSGRLVSGL
jgi:hypothetical protein